jgi:hypothetical protein
MDLPEVIVERDLTEAEIGENQNDDAHIVFAMDASHHGEVLDEDDIESLIRGLVEVRVNPGAEAEAIALFDEFVTEVFTEATSAEGFHDGESQ